MNQNFEYEAYLEEVKGMFPLPGILAGVMDTLGNPNATISDLSEIVVRDAALVSSIIRLSNSSYFSFSEPSQSLDEAMQRIGMREVSRLVSVCVSDQMYRSELFHYRIPPEVYWESSIAGALLMEALAEEAGAHLGKAYLAGLMREVGLLVIDQMLSGERKSAIWDCYAPLHEWERIVCGVDHAQMGELLLKRWGFPEDVVRAVGGQFTDSPGPGGAFVERALVLVNRILFQVGCDLSVSVNDWGQFAMFSEPLALEAGDLKSAYERVAPQFTKLRNLAAVGV